MTKKLISIVLSFCMIMSCFAIGGVTASAAETSGNVSASADGSQYAQDTIQGSNVLHCFNWTYNNIRANLADIAEAGYTAVQTSPVQQAKDYSPSYTTLGGEWWKLYQPLTLSVAASGTSYLGSPNELRMLCQEADEYGIKIIADIVANHVANNGTEGGGYDLVHHDVEEDLQDESYYHTSKDYISDANRRTMTQNHMKMPDLNTGDDYIQERVLGLLKECVDLGVDGFRFDAAKHIELPTDDASFASDFWPTVINGIKDYKSDVFVYGEILGSAGTDISNYTQYINITDDSVSNNARGAVYTSSPSASRLADYNYGKGAGDSKSVVWVESHDTYMDGSSSGMTSAQIMNTWAILGARANSTALYLARPNATMGAASSDTTWKNTAVAEVNKFKNFFNGSSEYMASSGNVAYVERGTQGVVLSKLNGAGSVSVPSHQIASGTYVDQVSGNTFTVSGGTISGQVGETGVAVVYNPEDEIEETTTPSGNITVLFTDALNWGAANVYYWNNGPEWPGTAMTLKETNSYGQKVYQATIPANVTGIIFNGGGNQTVDITTGIVNGAQWYTLDEKEGNNYKVGYVGGNTNETTAPVSVTPTTAPVTVPGSDITVLFTDVLNWGSPNVYYWDNGPDWPGKAMTFKETNDYGQKVYQASVPRTATGLIFNGGGNQTVDITTGIVDGAQWYTLDEKEGNNYKVGYVEVHTDDTTAPVTKPTTNDTTAPVETIKVYFTDALNWGSPTVYYWNDGPAWPGTAMTFAETNDYGENVYTATIPSNAEGIIFSGNGNQTVDITDNIKNGSQWYTINEKDGTNYKVKYVTVGGDDEPTTTVNPGTKSYCLFGFINGANYACEENNSQPSTYVFANGTLKATFNETSYVAVKTTDNADWYMTQGYPGDDATTATLYSTSVTGENSDKLRVPGGVEVTFTLKDNGNGSFTLSYTTGSVQPTTKGDETTTTVKPSGTITVLFTDALNWGAANVYYWDNGPAWPGTAMTFKETNDYGQKVYQATIPANVSGVIFNGNGNQTVDITTNILNGSQWYTLDEKEGNNYKVGYVEGSGSGSVQPTTKGDETTTTVKPSGTITVLFTDALNWGAANVYYWDNGPAWPGTAMTFKETNDYGQKVYQATIPANAEGLIFNGNGNQTVDIKTNILNGSQWYTVDEKEGNNYKVGYVEGSGSGSVQPTTKGDETTTTVKPSGTITVLFTDALNWGAANVYYWDNGPAWPGTAMTVKETNDYGQKVYQATIPANVSGLIFNGNGNQTVDITTNILNGSQWYTLDEKEGNNYKVGYVEGSGKVEPTTVAPTTVAPTTVEPTTVAPTTVEPTTAPVSDEAVDRDGTLIVGDDFTLMLNTASSTNVVGEIYLPAGQYKFRVQKDRTLMGYNATVNDKTTKGLTFNPKFKAQTTLVATGGTYKFQFSNTANALVIYHVDSEVPDAHLTGDLHTILKPVLGKEGLIASGSMYIAPGQYKFKVVNGETECGYGTTVNDKTADGKMLSINPKYQASLTLNATGGMYTFTLYTQTNKLKIAYVNDSAESKTDVHVAGDFNLVLNDNDGESDIATGTVTLAAGTYGFKVYNYGVVYTIGETINDSASKNLKNFYTKPLTLNAKGGTYSFTFNKTTGKLTVEKK